MERMTRKQMFAKRTADDMEVLSGNFHGSAQDLTISIIDLCRKNQTMKNVTESAGLSYRTVAEARTRKTGTTNYVLDSLLKTLGYELKVVKIDENAEP